MLSLIFLICLVPGIMGTSSKLIFKANNTFRVIMFTDMHYGETEIKDLKNLAFEATMVKLTQPDLVVIDGDASSNYAAPTCNPGAGSKDPCKLYVKRNWGNFTKPLLEAEVAYIYGLGNHDPIPVSDGSYAVPQHWLMQLDATNNEPLSHTKDGPQNIHGASNYVIPIYHKDEIAFYVWMLDSNDNNCLNQTGWGCVYPDQVSWYREVSERLFEQDGRRVPGIMFHHIPAGELLDAVNSPKVQVWGTSGEVVCCGSVNTGLVAAIMEMGNVNGLFHGHDHNNDYVALIDDLYIGYGRKSGYGGYGGVVADYPGARVFDITLNPTDRSVSWSTHIRLDTGERIDQTPMTDRPVVQVRCCGIPTNSHVDRCRRDDDARSCRIATGIDYRFI